MSEWIKIKDKQPEKGELVYARFSKFLSKGVIYKEVDCYIGIIEFDNAKKSKEFCTEKEYALDITEWRRFI